MNTQLIFHTVSKVIIFSLFIKFLRYCVIAHKCSDDKELFKKHRLLEFIQIGLFGIIFARSDSRTVAITEFLLHGRSFSLGVSKD